MFNIFGQTRPANSGPAGESLYNSQWTGLLFGARIVIYLDYLWHANHAWRFYYIRMLTTRFGESHSI